MFTRVGNVMVSENIAVLGPDATMREAIVLLAERRGTVAVVNEERRVVGVVTAGDLTRLMQREEHFLDVPVSRVMNRRPKVTRADELGSAAVFQMEKHGIMAMPVLDADDRVLGMVHLHDLMRAGAA